MLKSYFSAIFNNHFGSTKKIIPLLLIGALCGLFSACDSTNEELVETRKENVEADRSRMQRMMFTRPLDMETAVSYGLKYNLEAKLEERKQEIQKEITKRSWFKLLPSLEGSFDYTNRNNLRASQSVNLETGRVSEATSYSSEKESQTYGINLVWNILDFGISYLQARQAEDDQAIIQQEYRRTRQNLALNISRAYWRCLVNTRAALLAEALIGKVEEEHDSVVKQMADRAILKPAGLEKQARLQKLLLRLRDFTRQAEASKAELAGYLSLSPGTRFELNSADFPYITKFDAYDVEALETEALLSRPELYQEDYKERITQEGVRISILRMLPSPSVFLNHSWDDNPHLYANYWYSVGVKAASNLLDLPRQMTEVKAGTLREELVQQRRMTVAMGILTQIRLTLIQYRSAAERCLALSEILQVQNEFQSVTEKLVREGRTSQSNLLTASVDTFFTYLQYMQAYADVMAMKEQVKNTVGRDPVISKEPLPVQMYIAEGGQKYWPQMLDSPWNAQKVAAIKPVEIEREYGVNGTAYQDTPETVRPRYRPGEIVPAETGAYVPGEPQSLDAIALQLGDARYRIASEAKQKLLDAGEEGARAALSMINSPNQRARILAILVIREAGGRDTTAQLLPLLSDQDPLIRYHGSLALKDAFGQDFGYHPADAESARANSIQRWQEFLSPYYKGAAEPQS
ncbi:MAG: TolC family protein [Planctomycetes bacterium]|nr:TolC family protein [Planctomycetota bacterium]